MFHSNADAEDKETGFPEFNKSGFFDFKLMDRAIENFLIIYQVNSTFFSIATPGEENFAFN